MTGQRTEETITLDSLAAHVSSLLDTKRAKIRRSVLSALSVVPAVTSSAPTEPPTPLPHGKSGKAAAATAAAVKETDGVWVFDGSSVLSRHVIL